MKIKIKIERNSHAPRSNFSAETIPFRSIISRSYFSIAVNQINMKLQLASIGVVAVIVFHLVISPYSKVEESFNIQAIHDIINYGVGNIDTYDHNEFPGVVPRTFIGSLTVAAITTPIVKAAEVLGVKDGSGSQFWIQFLIRGIIGALNGWQLLRLARTINTIDFASRRKRTPSPIGTLFYILLMSQFHLLYYSSRTLPNFMALPLVNFSINKVLAGDMTGLTWMAFTGVVFRLEVGIFGVVIAVVSSLGFGQSDLFINGFLMLAGSILGAILSATVDSYFWGYLVIPEISSFIFNVMDGGSVKWGVEPVNAYFSKYLFQIFRPPIILILALVGITNDPADDGVPIYQTPEVPIVKRPSKNSLRILLVSSVLYIGVMSLQPHKEWRFIVYTFPVFTLSAANGLATLNRRWRSGISNSILLIILYGLIVLATVSSLMMGFVSKFNYPGGHALVAVNEYLVDNGSSDQIVHLDVAACMSGVTRFGQLHDCNVTYDKTEFQQLSPDIRHKFDVIVTETPFEDKKYSLLTTITKFEGISIGSVLNFIHIKSGHQGLVSFIINTINEVIVNQTIDPIKQLLQAPIIESDYLYAYVTN